ncbi:MAG: hypothetical protein Q7S73_00060 [bacterium]|nr:hypothetical protein [bacterium]
MAKRAEAVMYMIQWRSAFIGKMLGPRRFKIDWKKRIVILKNAKNDTDAIKQFQTFKEARIRHEEYRDFKLFKFERKVLVI